MAVRHRQLMTHCHLPGCAPHTAYNPPPLAWLCVTGSLWPTVTCLAVRHRQLMTHRHLPGCAPQAAYDPPPLAWLCATGSLWPTATCRAVRHRQLIIRPTLQSNSAHHFHWQGIFVRWILKKYYTGEKWGTAKISSEVRIVVLTDIIAILLNQGLCSPIPNDIVSFSSKLALLSSFYWPLGKDVILTIFWRRWNKNYFEAI